MDELAWINSMCNKIGCLSQGWGKHAGTDIIEFILHQYKPKDIRSTYVTAVCVIRPHKKETPVTRLSARVNIIDYPGEFSTPASDLNTMKLHVNSAISDIKSRYMCMDVKWFYLNN